MTTLAIANVSGLKTALGGRRSDKRRIEGCGIVSRQQSHGKVRCYCLRYGL